MLCLTKVRSCTMQYSTNALLKSLRVSSKSRWRIKQRSALPSFKDEYQSWYSEAKALIRQLLPDRLSDFTRYYEKPKSRKDITYENYTIEDYLQGLNVTRTAGMTTSTVVGPDAATEPREVYRRTLPELAL